MRTDIKPTWVRKGEYVQTDIKPTWVSYEGAQQLVGLGRTTLWRLANTGELRTARVGRAVRISVESLEAYMQRCPEENVQS
jgi:excisionase family DNA binding protein